MSTENFRNFYANIVENDEDLKAKLKAATNADDFMKVAEPAAKKAGLDFSAEDVLFVLHGELQEEELEAVAGGMISRIPIVAGKETKPGGKCPLFSQTGDCCYDW